MPEEFSRTTARKRITLPGGGSVDIPVITKISFIDPSDRHQEVVFSIDNSAAADRIVRVDNVDSINVERILQWKVSDSSDRGQESWVTTDNTTLGDNPPPYFITHQRTHIVKYKGGPNTWIESELIDEIAFVDPSDRGQETVYTLNNPLTDDDAQANPSDPDISDTANGVDPPYRTDPFQNLVAISQGGGGSLIVSAWFHEYPSGGGGYPNSDMRVYLAGWSVGDTWSGLPTPSGQGFDTIFTFNIGDPPLNGQGEDAVKITYTVGTELIDYPGWNDTMSFQIDWAVFLGSDPQLQQTRTYDVTGATLVRDGVTYEIIGTAAGNIDMLNKWSNVPPAGLPSIFLLYVPATA